MDEKVANVYGNRVRVRACGICWKDDGLLLVNHKGITPTNFWSPPGGGVEFGQSITETLRKEFKEETGLIVKPGDFLFGCEYIEKPIHSIELFYAVEYVSGELHVGFDPEIQIIQDVQFMRMKDIHRTAEEQLHGIFRIAKTPEAFQSLKGFFRI
jgi:8-oxo-dGTP diphosphatase